MKWWGWGKESKAFSTTERPFFSNFIKDVMKFSEFPQPQQLATFEQIELSDSLIPLDKLIKLKSLFSDEVVFTSKRERLLHGYGKSFRDLYRLRRGLVKRVPDAVLYPETIEDVVRAVEFANLENYALIPFGGGTNIVGGVEVLENRPSLCLDLKRLNRVLSVDEDSQLAEIEAGALGPQLEYQLGNKGWTLGHFPDSFEFSTLGGWIATRSAGMQSDQYGKIEDMVVALTVVTPKGMVETLAVPKASSGVDIKQMFIGSEGLLGVIVKATMRVHKKVKEQEFRGYFFPNFESGVAALKECTQAGILPVMSRLNDPNKTKMSMAFKKEATSFEAAMKSVFKFYASKLKKIYFDQAALALCSFESQCGDITQKIKATEKVFKKYGALSLGSSPGKTFNETKYDFPYVRDYVMDFDIIADVSETCTKWSNFHTLYQAVNHNISELAKQLNTEIFLSCHVSHTYPTGASLYFTWASPAQAEIDSLKKYDLIKSCTENTFVEHGATYSHHHATGYEHMPWVEQEIGKTGILALSSLKDGLDPSWIMNPGKIIGMAGREKSGRRDIPSIEK